MWWIGGRLVGDRVVPHVRVVGIRPVAETMVHHLGIPVRVDAQQLIRVAVDEATVFASQRQAHVDGRQVMRIGDVFADHHLVRRGNPVPKDLVATHVAGLLPGLDLAGQWSLDIMRDGDDYWLIDMAPAERSTFYEQAVPKGKRRPMMENWMPELGGEH